MADFEKKELFVMDEEHFEAEHVSKSYHDFR